MALFSIVFMIVTIFASYKLAQEKAQNTIIWPIATAFLGGIVFIVQYLVSIYMNNKKLI